MTLRKYDPVGECSRPFYDSYIVPFQSDSMFFLLNKRRNKIITQLFDFQISVPNMVIIYVCTLILIKLVTKIPCMSLITTYTT